MSLKLVVCNVLIIVIIVQAEKLIRDQLAENETATLLCYLGDVTGDAQHYHRAWEVSGRRSARSQRALAYFHFNKAQVYREVLVFCSAVRILVFPFRFESNSYRQSQKSPVVSTC